VVEPLPLSTLLSQTLVALTIEMDNEVEHRLPHRTTRGDGDGRGPWLTSYAMWANVLQYLGDDPITVAELGARARTARLQLGGLRRWGYVHVDAPEGESVRNPPQDGALVRLKVGGGLAQDVWRPVPKVVAARWRARFGRAGVDALIAALRAVLDADPIDPPCYLPLVFPTQNGKVEQPPARGHERRPVRDLPSLLSGVLIAFTLDFEAESRISLTTGANTLRVLTVDGVRVRDLPLRTGVSKEANAMCTGWLRRHGCATLEDDPTASRGKVVRLTPKGVKAQQKFRRLLAATEEAWVERLGADVVARLRAALEPLVGDGTLPASPLTACLDPFPDNWRATVRPPATLPHHPMVLHRGGYPDGS
jgi:hypothetical protein